MISYSTNMMGPWHTGWYIDRGLTVKKTRVLEKDSLVSGKKKGDTISYDEVTEHYAGGRIDIYGLSEEEYYGGKSEYGIPVMIATDWEDLSEFLDNFKSVELISYDKIISLFEESVGRKIGWAAV